MSALSELAASRELDVGPGVRVWSAALDVDRAAYAQARSILSPDERVRAEAFPDSVRGERFAVGRSVLRQILADVTGTAADQLRFVYHRDGKPSLDDGGESARVEFNLSHARDQMLVAVTVGRRVGVDIAWTGGIAPLERVVDRFFSPAEQDAVRNALGDERRHVFSRIWVRKEAYLKGRGEGVSAWIYSTDFTGGLAPEREIAVTEPLRDQDAWELRDVADLPHGFVGSVAIERVR